MSTYLTCSRCVATADQDSVAGLPADPSGWSVITITGHPIRNVRLCPTCANAVRTVIDAPADRPAEIPA
jgi:hypothetical protein